MNRRTFNRAAVISPILLTTTGCQTLMGIDKDTAIDAVKGGSAVAEAKDMHDEIMAYLNGDEIATKALSEPVAFFKVGADFLEGKLDVPVLDIFEAQPDYVEDVPVQWGAGKAVLNEYAERTNQPIPASIMAWIGNAEAGWEVVKKAASVQDKIVKAVELYKIVKPFALMAL